jgi:hypothetical protein
VQDICFGRSIREVLTKTVLKISIKKEVMLEDETITLEADTPDWKPLIGRYEDKEDIGIYSFDGGSFIEREKVKVWCFGHVHEHHDYINKGCRFVNNALGYPKHSKGRKIRTIVCPLKGVFNTEVSNKLLTLY